MLKKQNKIVFFVIKYVIFVVFMSHSLDLTADMYDLDINTAIKMGIDNNLNIANKKISLQSSTLDVASSWTNMLSSSIGVSYKNEIIEQNEPKASAGTVNITMNNSLNINAANIYRIVNSVNSYQSGKLSFEDAKAQLVKEIKQSYFNLAIQKQKIWLQQIKIDNAKISYDTATVKYRDGMISEVELLKNEYAYKSEMPALDSLNISYINTEETFKQIIGLKIPNILHFTTKIPDDISQLTLNLDVAKNLDNNFSISNYILRLKNVINSRNQSIIAAATPSLSLSHSLSFFNNNEFQPNNEVGLSLSFSIDTPIPFSSEQVNIAKNVLSVKQASNELQNAKEMKIIELNKLISEIELAEKNIENYKMNTIIAEKTFDMTQRLYNAGSTSYLEYQDAKKNVFDARLKIITEKNTYLSKIFELEYELQLQLLEL